MALGSILWCYLGWVIPTVEEQLRSWDSMARAIPDDSLRKQALASLSAKRFHCQGGAVFAAGPGAHRLEVLRFIVALQTISDYLDNLCDRAGVIDEAAFRLLHQAMLDAVTRSGTESGLYYDLFPFRNDGGYLQALVNTCREALAPLPSYDVVKSKMQRLVDLYVDLQVYKHVEHSVRLPRLVSWFQREWEGEFQLHWQEFAAACGSTLGVFALCYEAASPGPVDLQPLLDFLFPWAAGFHIMLDYLIDLSEDEEGGDLNFVDFYTDLDEAEQRIGWFYEEAMKRVPEQGNRALYTLVLHGLPALYLTDPKVALQGQTDLADRLLRRGGHHARILRVMCRWARHFGL